jgi:hypothetical protein
MGEIEAAEVGAVEEARVAVEGGVAEEAGAVETSERNDEVGGGL